MIFLEIKFKQKDWPQKYGKCHIFIAQNHHTMGPLIDEIQ